MTGMELEVVGEIPLGLNLDGLGRIVAATQSAAAELRLPDGIVNLTFANDAQIKAYNRDYSGNDYATDVLSFSYLESGGAIEGVVGEIIISFETAERQARAAGVSLDDEVAVLALHGLLHIGGYDHQDNSEREQLQAIQQRLAAAANVSYREFAWQD